MKIYQVASAGDWNLFAGKHTPWLMDMTEMALLAGRARAAIAYNSLLAERRRLTHQQIAETSPGEGYLRPRGNKVRLISGFAKPRVSMGI